MTGLGRHWDMAGSFAAYAIPAVLMAVAFVIKLPLLRRAWQDPILRATALLLGIGALIFASLPPGNLHRINEATGVPNFAGVWVYSLLTAYCGACLWLIITWREPPSAVRRRRTRLVWIAYAVIIVGLWVTFALGDHHVERLRDLDTYYANTPWMREHTMLYLVAHMVSAVVAAAILWAWFQEVADKWLRRAVVCLQVAYALGFIFDVAKVAAIVARWAGRDWDYLSTYVAPPFAIAEAFLVSVGFIAGQAGPYCDERRRLWRTHRSLEPLWREMLTVGASPAPATGRVSGAELRLELRRAAINDGLLRLSPYLSGARRERARRQAVAAGHTECTARGIAGAVDILVAVDALRTAARGPAGPAGQTHDPYASDTPYASGTPDVPDLPGVPDLPDVPDTPDVPDLPGVPDTGPHPHPQVRHAAHDDSPTDLPDRELESVAYALRVHSPVVETLRRQAAATEGLITHA